MDEETYLEHDDFLEKSLLELQEPTVIEEEEVEPLVPEEKAEDIEELSIVERAAPTSVYLYDIGRNVLSTAYKSFGEAEIFKQEYIKQAQAVLNSVFTRRIPDPYTTL